MSCCDAFIPGDESQRKLRLKCTDCDCDVDDDGDCLESCCGYSPRVCDRCGYQPCDQSC